MDMNQPQAGLSTDAAALADPAAMHCAMLAELAEIGMAVARALRRQIEAGQGVAEPVAALGEVALMVRRTIALHAKLHADSLLTYEQRAALRASRIAAAERARLQDRKEAVGRAVATEISAHAEARGEPREKTERLLADLNERLLDPVVEAAFGHRDNSAIILGLCKALDITPRKETWSDEAMHAGILEHAAEVRRAMAARARPEGAVPDPQFKAPPPDASSPEALSPDAPSPDAPPPEAPPPESPWVEKRIGPLVFGPTGAVIRVEKADPPPSAWPADCLPGSDPPARW
jgi:hypothetical protein